MRGSAAVYTPPKVSPASVGKTKPYFFVFPQLTHIEPDAQIYEIDNQLALLQTYPEIACK